MLYWVGPPRKQRNLKQETQSLPFQLYQGAYTWEEQRISVLGPGSVAHHAFPLMFIHLTLLSFAPHLSSTTSWPFFPLLSTRNTFMSLYNTIWTVPLLAFFLPTHLEISVYPARTLPSDSRTMHLLKQDRQRGRESPLQVRTLSSTKVRKLAEWRCQRHKESPSLPHLTGAFGILHQTLWQAAGQDPHTFLHSRENYPVPMSAPLGETLTLYTGWSEVDCVVLAAYRIADLAGIRLWVALWRVDIFKHTAL